MTRTFRFLAAGVMSAGLLGGTIAAAVQLADGTQINVLLTTPDVDAHVHGTVSVGASVSGAAAGVQFLLDGEALGAEDTSAPFAVSWDTKDAWPGSHLLSARARDAGGNVAETELHPVVVVRPDEQPPTVSANPASGTVFGPSLTVTLTANEPARIYYTTDGNPATDSSANAQSPVTVPSFSTTTTIRYFARDTWGNASAPASATYVRNADTVAPSVTPPAEAISAGELGTSGIPVTITWSGTDAGSGISSYEVQRSTDGGATWRAESLSSPLRTSKDVVVVAGTAYRFQVRATDAAGNISPYAVAPSFRALIHEDGTTTGPAGTLSYQGAWTAEPSTSASGGSRRHASLAGARATLSFTGRSVAWVAERGPGKGEADVYVDGVRVATVDLYNSSTRARFIAFRRAFATSGTHTIEVRIRGTKKSDSSGTRVDVDAFVLTH